MSKRPAAPRRSLALVGALVAVCLVGCERRPSPESLRIDQLDLKIQQLETRLNQVRVELRQPDRGSRVPRGAIKSLTYRTTDAGNRLRIYWADGSQTDLECNQEQSTLACG